eukprot:5020155-Amphidinium_carterae.1
MSWSVMSVWFLPIGLISGGASFDSGRCTDGEALTILDRDGDALVAFVYEGDRRRLFLCLEDWVDEALELCFRFFRRNLAAARCGEGVLFTTLDRESDGTTLVRSGGFGGLGSGLARAEPPWRKSFRKSTRS